MRPTNSVAYVSAEQYHSQNYIQGYFSAKIGSCSYSVAESIFILAFCVDTGQEDNPFPQNQVFYLLKCTTKHLKKVISASPNRGLVHFVVCPH